MKTKQILIILAVILIVVIIVNWISNKKFFRYGGDVKVLRNNYDILSERYYCCRKLNEFGDCLVWKIQDFPCETEMEK